MNTKIGFPGYVSMVGFVNLSGRFKETDHALVTRKYNFSNSDDIENLNCLSKQQCFSENPYARVCVC